MAKRNILSNIFSRFNLKQLDTENQALSRSIANFDSMYAVGPEHDLLLLLDECSVSGSIPLPRQWMSLSRLMYAKISIYKDAVDKTADFVGKVRIGEKTDLRDDVRTMVESFWKDVSILSEVENKVATIKGMNSLVNELVKISLKDGISFAEDRFEVYDEEISDEFLGEMIFDSQNFEYVPAGQTASHILRYLGNQFPTTNPDTGESLDNQYFHTLKLEHDPRSAWGLPLAAGDELLSKTIITLLISIELQSKRFGNPPSFTTVVPKSIERMDFMMEIGGKKMSLGDAMLIAAKNFKASLEAAWALSQRGKAAEVVAGFPAPVDVASQVLGEGMVNMVDADLLWKLCVLLINGFGVPPALMNVNVTSGGMNSDMFSTSIQVFRSRINKIRERVSPIVKQMTVNYLLSQGISPVEAERISIEFEDVDLQSAKERAEAKKVEAETKKIQIQNYEILSNYSEEGARKYAEDVGLRLERD